MTTLAEVDISVYMPKVQRKNYKDILNMENIKAMLEKELPELIAMQQRITKLAEQQLASIDISKASPLDKMRFEEGY